jgi:hypothetical protein
MSNLPYAAPAPANSQMPEQSSGTTSPQPQVARASQVQVGMPVVGSDMSNIGLIKQVRDNDFLVDIAMQRDLYVPFTAVQEVEADQVVLNILGSQVKDMNWAKPSLF